MLARTVARTVARTAARKGLSCTCNIHSYCEAILMATRPSLLLSAVLTRGYPWPTFIESSALSPEARGNGFCSRGPCAEGRECRDLLCTRVLFSHFVSRRLNLSPRRPRPRRLTRRTENPYLFYPPTSV